MTFEEARGNLKDLELREFAYNHAAGMLYHLALGYAAVLELSFIDAQVDDFSAVFIFLAYRFLCQFQNNRPPLAPSPHLYALLLYGKEDVFSRIFACCGAYLFGGR